MEGRGDAEHRHDDRLVLLVDVDLHVPDLLFSGHLGHVFVGHVGFSGSGGERLKLVNFLNSSTLFTLNKLGGASTSSTSSYSWKSLDVKRQSVSFTAVFRYMEDLGSFVLLVDRTPTPTPTEPSSLLNVLLSFLLRQSPLGFFVQVVGQLLLVSPPLLLRRHLVLKRR